MKRRRHEEHASHERWLVSYADLITLLFALFVIMYAMSQADLEKFKKVSESLKKSLRAPAPPGAKAEAEVTLRVGPRDGAPTAAASGSPSAKGGAAGAGPETDAELRLLKAELDDLLRLEAGQAAGDGAVTGAPTGVKVEWDRQGLAIRMTASRFFPDGSVEVPSDLRPLLDRVGRAVADTTREIRIEGHSDPNEARPAKFPSDWELSAARAGWVAKFFMDRFRIAPERIGIAGYAHYRPRAGESVGRRRVEILVLKGNSEK